MTARRTLASKGFELPNQIPQIPSGFNGRGWSAHALMVAIAEFARPSISTFAIWPTSRTWLYAAMDEWAEEDGFSVGFREPHSISKSFEQINSSPNARETVAAWLGIPVEQIWPHHAQASARPVRAWRKAAATAVQSDGNSDGAATLMAPMYIGTHAPCRPNVHVVPNRVNRRAAAVIIGLAAAAITVAYRFKRGGAR